MLGDVGEFMGKEDDATGWTEPGAQSQEPEMRAVVGFKLCCVIQADRDVMGSGKLDQPGSDVTLAYLLKGGFKLVLLY